MSETTADERLRELGIVLPAASPPAARYANCVEVNGLLFVAGKGPTGSGGAKPRGKLGREFTTQDGYGFAREAGIAILAVLRDELGTLNRVKRVVKLQGFVNATADFEEHHKVLDGCSALMLDVFGERGLHARSVSGAPSLRENVPVVVDSIFEISND